MENNNLLEYSYQLSIGIELWFYLSKEARNMYVYEFVNKRIGAHFVSLTTGREPYAHFFCIIDVHSNSAIATARHRQ